MKPISRRSLVPVLIAAAFWLPGTAMGACEELRDRIGATIESNGVPPLGYSLEVIPTEDADQAEGEIVGHCRNNRYQIVYQRQSYTPEASRDTPSVADERTPPEVSVPEDSAAADAPPADSPDEQRVHTVHEPE